MTARDNGEKAESLKRTLVRLRKNKELNGVRVPTAWWSEGRLARAWGPMAGGFADAWRYFTLE
jgi:hypothetical protein